MKKKKSTRTPESSDSGDGGLLREIEEELRFETVIAWLRSYGIKAALALTIIGITVLALLWYQNTVIEERQNLGTRLSSALLSFEAEKTTDVITDLQNLLDDSNEVEIYRALSQLAIANIYLAQDENSKATDVYKNIAEDEKIDDFSKSLAKVRLTALRLDVSSYSEVKDYLSQIASDKNNGWRFLASELLALSAYKNAEYKEALKWLKIIHANKAEVPLAILTRADIIKSVLTDYDNQ